MSVPPVPGCSATNRAPRNTSKVRSHIHMDRFCSMVPWFFSFEECRQVECFSYLSTRILTEQISPKSNCHIPLHLFRSPRKSWNSHGTSTEQTEQTEHLPIGGVSVPTGHGYEDRPVGKSVPLRPREAAQHLPGGVIPRPQPAAPPRAPRSPILEHQTMNPRLNPLKSTTLRPLSMKRAVFVHEGS